MASNLQPPRKNDSNNSLNQRNTSTIPQDLYHQLNAGNNNNNNAKISNLAGRPTFTEIQLEEAHELRMSPEEKKSRRREIQEQRLVGKETKDTRTKAIGIITKILPCIKVFSQYKLKEYAVFDLLSGLSVGLFAIPQAIAYTLLANVNPQYGFFSAFFAMLIYFVFGTSRHLNMTHQGAVSLLVGEYVRAGVQQVYADRLCAAENTSTTDAATTTLGAFVRNELMTSSAQPQDCVDPDEANIMISVTLTMIVGVLQLTLGFLRFGFITIYFSDPLNSAFTCGAALHILSSQLANIFGIEIAPINSYGKFFILFYEAFKQVFNGGANLATIVIFAGFFVALLAVKLINEKCSKYVKIPIPMDIIVLVSSLLMSRFLEWEKIYGIAIVGNIPKGFEAPRAPQLEHFTSGTGIIINGIVLGIIAYSLSVSVAKTFAMRHGYEVDANQEMIAYGAVNFGMSWFNTFASASSIACTSLHESMRGKTLVYTLYAAMVTLLGILVLAPEFAPVPKCVLSAIIVVNLKNMMLQFEQLPSLWRTNRYDFAIWIVTLSAILGLDLPMGLLTGVIFSLATVIFRSQAPKAYLVGRVPNTDIYKNIKKNKTAEEIEGVKIFKFDGSLYFASAENFRQRLYRQVAMNPKKILVKAQAMAKIKGGDDDDTGIRTEVVTSDEIRDELDRVQNEGQAGDMNARLKAQNAGEFSSNSLSTLGRDNDDNYDYDDDNDDDGAQPTVNVFCIILDMAACAFTDAVGIRLLKQIVEDFHKIGVEIYLSGCSSLVRSQLRKGHFFHERDEDGVFVTVHDAVMFALSQYYKELLEEEKEMNANDSNEETVTSSPRRPKISLASTGSEAEAREMRRITRKISRQQNYHPDVTQLNHPHLSRPADQPTSSSGHREYNPELPAGSREDADNERLKTLPNVAVAAGADVDDANDNTEYVNHGYENDQVDTDM